MPFFKLMAINSLLTEEIVAQNFPVGVGGKVVFIKSGLVSKRLKSYETPTAETICLELNISDRKWFIVFAYRPESIDRNLFFDEISICLGKAANSYDFLSLAGDLNIDMDIPNTDRKHF